MFKIILFVPTFFTVLLSSSFSYSINCSELLSNETARSNWNIRQKSTLPEGAKIDDLMSNQTKVNVAKLGLDFSITGDSTLEVTTTKEWYDLHTLNDPFEIFDIRREESVAVGRVKLQGTLRSIELIKDDSSPNYLLSLIIGNHIAIYEINKGSLTEASSIRIPSEINQGLNTHRITEFKDSGNYYNYSIEGVNGGWSTSTSIDKSEADVILRHFNLLDDPSALVGYEFKSLMSDGSMALSDLTYRIHNRGFYRPTNDSDLYNQVAQSLASFEEPVFANSHREDLFRAFNHAFSDPTWLENLKERVYTESGGQVKLEETSSEGFKYRVMGLAHYLKLVRTTPDPNSGIFGYFQKQQVEELHIIITPSSDPVSLFEIDL